MKRILPPGLPGSLLLGNLKAYKNGPASYPRQLLNAHPGEKIAFLRMLHQKVFFVLDPGVAQEVLIERSQNFPKAAIAVKTMSNIVGPGILSMADGPEQRERRKLAQPAFVPKRINAYGPIVTHFTNNALSHWQDGQVRNVVSEMTHISMGVISKMLFDTAAPEQAAEISRNIDKLQEITVASYFRGFTWPDWLPVKSVRETKSCRATLGSLMDNFIDEHQAFPDKFQGDLLSALLQSRSDNKVNISRQDLRADLLNLFVAGHETTSNALAWTFYLLSQHPEAEKKLLTELDSILDTRTPAFEDLAQLPFLDQVFKESLRLYPPAFALTIREARVDESLGGFQIKKGDFVSIMPYLMHRLPQFFPDPEVFRPERFLPEEETQRHKLAYIPFGAGHRFCIGNNLAMMEGKLVLATILKRFRLVLEGNQPVEQSELVTLSPRDGLPMRLVARKKAVVNRI